MLDGNGAKIGEVKEELLKSAFSVGQRYEIKNSTGNIVGYTKEMDILKDNIEILNASDALEAKFGEGIVHIVRESWQISFYGNSIGRRLVLFFPAFTTQRQQ